MKNPWVIIALLIVVLVSGSVWYSGKVSAKYNDGVQVQNHIKGNADSKIVLTEFSDFQCPACAGFQPIVNEVLEKHGDKLKFEYKHFPLTQIHPSAVPAALAAESAGQQGKFFEYADMLFAKQSEWSKSTNPMALFAKYASELGLDATKFSNYQKSSLLQDAVLANAKEARDLKLTGTPSFFLNGVKMEFSSYDDFRSQIDNAINPQVDFSLDGTNPGVKMVEVEGEAPAAPAVQFGI